MIVALLLGRKGSKGFPGKNTYPVLDHPLAWYPMITALNVSEIDMTFLSTDDPELMQLATELGISIIERPPELASDDALGEHAYVHGYQEIQKHLAGSIIDMLVLMMCNAATITSKSISEGIEHLKTDPNVDSAVTVSRYNMWSPLRARTVNECGLMEPFVPFEAFGDPDLMNCDRDSQGDVWFADMGCSVVRSRCLEHIEQGMLPQKWMGKNILPLYQEAGFDLDYEWQVPLVEWWIKTYWDGFSG